MSGSSDGDGCILRMYFSSQNVGKSTENSRQKSESIRQAKVKRSVNRISEMGLNTQKMDETIIKSINQKSNLDYNAQHNSLG